MGVPFIPYAVVNEAGGGPSPSFEALVDEMLVDSPVALWRMDEQSGMPQDVSGNGNHITTQTGTFLKGELPDHPGLLFTDLAFIERTRVSASVNDLTVEMWAFVVGAPPGDLEWFFRGATNRGFSVLLMSDRKFRVVANFVGFLATSAGTIPFGSWTQVVVKRDSADSNRWKYLVNGAVDTANAGTTSPNAVNAGDVDRFGVSSVKGAYALGPCAVYDTALSDARIDAHWDASV